MDIEVLGAAVGGDDGDFTFNGEPAGYVQRPPGVRNLPKGVCAACAQRIPWCRATSPAT